MQRTASCCSLVSAKPTTCVVSATSAACNAPAISQGSPPQVSSPSVTMMIALVTRSPPGVKSSAAASSARASGVQPVGSAAATTSRNAGLSTPSSGTSSSVARQLTRRSASSLLPSWP
jgi:hypothetical protein